MGMTTGAGKWRRNVGMELKSGEGKHKKLGMIVEFLEKESGDGAEKWGRKTQKSGDDSGISGEGKWGW